jgi:hypothetical protein
MSVSTDKLLKLKEELEQAKLDKAQLQGALDQNLNRLKEEFKVKSLDEAKKKLQSLIVERSDLVIKIDNAVKSLEEKYQW